MENTRAQRIAGQIQCELGQSILFKIKDPRLKFMSITDVKISRDLSHAKIYFTIIDKQYSLDDIEKSLKKANGFLRSLLAENLKLRIVPTLRFIYDESIDNARYISNLIDTALKDDQLKNDNTDVENNTKVHE